MKDINMLDTESISVPAISQEEAESRVDAWLNGQRV
jgi:hypothetical protein